VSECEVLAKPIHDDWRDGFLFVGNQLSLDFLNTRPVAEGKAMELLPDCAALVRWLQAATIVAPRQAREIQDRWQQPAFCVAIGQLQQFRESLREAVSHLEKGLPPTRAFLAEVNRLLSAYPYKSELVQTESGILRRKQFDPQTPLDAFAPIAESVAELLTTANPSRIRKCDCPQCVLHFYDTSKKGTRRWCSMNLCGNRFKVAAYARRKRCEA
jgi:predicted RNA-binding Zn ribbon-like protein